MSFLSSATFRDASLSPAWLPSWESAFQQQAVGQAADLLNRVNVSAREVLGTLAAWVEAEPTDADKRRSFYNIVMGVHPEDSKALDELAPLVQSVQRGQCTLQEMPDSSPGVWRVVNEQQQTVGVFKVGERRAFMEILARRIAFVMGLEDWIVPGTIVAATEVSLPLPPYERASQDRSAVGKPLRPWAARDERIAKTQGRQMAIETFGWQRKILHPDQGTDPAGITQGALVGILTPYVDPLSHSTSRSEYDSSFLGMTATAIVLGLSQATARSQMGDRWIEAKTCLPSYLDPEPLEGEEDVCLPDQASTGLAYLEMPCAPQILKQEWEGARETPEEERGRRVGQMPRQVIEMFQHWEERVQRAMIELDEASPLFWDGVVEKCMAPDVRTRHPVLSRDSNGVLFHMEAINPDPHLNPALNQQRPFNTLRVDAFFERVDRLQALGQEVENGALLEPREVVKQIDPIAQVLMQHDEQASNFLVLSWADLESEEAFFDKLSSFTYLVGHPASPFEAMMRPVGGPNARLGTEDELIRLGLVASPIDQRPLGQWSPLAFGHRSIHTPTPPFIFSPKQAR